MEFSEIINQRSSIRSFTDQSVGDDLVDSILRIVRTAPTAGNRQAYQVYVVRDEQARRRLAEAAYHQNFIREASVCLAFFADPTRSSTRYGSRGTDLYCIQDATIATTLAWLAAVDLGLASVWVGAFNDSAVCRAIDSPPGLRPVALLPLGWAAETPGKTPRRPLEQFVEWI